MSATSRTNGSTSGSANSSTGGVQSVSRALSLLEILAREGSAGVSEAAAEIGVHKSTAFRLLTALEEHDFVEQTTDRGKYQLGFGVLRMAAAVPGRLDVIRQAQPVLDDLAGELDETVNLAVMRENYAVHVQQALGSSVVAIQNWVGQLTPLHATSSGKVLLAALDPEQLAQTIAATGLDRYTESTLTDTATLTKQLAEIRKTGLATAHEELEEGLNAVSVPVRDHTNTVVAALSVSGPAYRLDEARIRDVESQVRAAGEHVSRRMGWLG